MHITVAVWCMCFCLKPNWIRKPRTFWTSEAWTNNHYAWFFRLFFRRFEGPLFWRHTTITKMRREKEEREWPSLNPHEKKISLHNALYWHVDVYEVEEERTSTVSKNKVPFEKLRLLFNIKQNAACWYFECLCIFDPGIFSTFKSKS